MLACELNCKLNIFIRTVRAVKQSLIIRAHTITKKITSLDLIRSFALYSRVYCPSMLILVSSVGNSRKKASNKSYDVNTSAHAHITAQARKVSVTE